MLQVQRSIEIMRNERKAIHNEKYLSEIILANDKKSKLHSLIMQDILKNPIKKPIPIKGLSFSKNSIQIDSKKGSNLINIESILDSRKQK